MSAERYGACPQLRRPRRLPASSFWVKSRSARAGGRRSVDHWAARKLPDTFASTAWVKSAPAPSCTPRSAGNAQTSVRRYNAFTNFRP